MALFAADDATIKSRLRLTGVPADAADTQSIISDAIRRARLSFYRRLEALRINQILDTAEVAEPATDEQVLRSLAVDTEVKLVQVDLYRRLPIAFMDASGDVNRRWNTEAPVREYPRSDREREVQRLLTEIEEAMQMLEAEEESPGDESSVKTYDGTPEEAAPFPGFTVQPPEGHFVAED